MSEHGVHLTLLALVVVSFFVLPKPVAILFSAAGAVAAVAFSVALTRTLRLPPKTGVESLVDHPATVVEWQGHSGLVRCKAELWQARGPRALAQRTAVRVVRVEGLVLQVEPMDSVEPPAEPSGV